MTSDWRLVEIRDRLAILAQRLQDLSVDLDPALSPVTVEALGELHAPIARFRALLTRDIAKPPADK